MKTYFFKLLSSLVLGLLVMQPSSPYAATSAMDNSLGGAGIAYWQAGGGWTSLVNIQSHYECSLVHVGVYDKNGSRVNSFNLPLRPYDNVGIVVQGDGTNIYLNDYSDNAYGGTTTLNDINGGAPAVHPSTADADGVQRGYMTFVQTNEDCSGPGGAPAINITGEFYVVADNLWVRSAMISPNSAFALNAVMFQGFANVSGENEIWEDSDFIDTTVSPNDYIISCDFNNNGKDGDIFVSLDDTSGADIDFPELFLTDNIGDFGFDLFSPYIVCNPGNVVYNALGSNNFTYGARFNRDPGAGTETMLIIVSPQSNQASATRFPRNLSVSSCDDDGNCALYGPTSIPVVAAVPFGPSGINIGFATAGEAFVTFTAPAFGFSYTETASFADLYPLVRHQVAIMSFNQDGVDDAADIILLP